MLYIDDSDACHTSQFATLMMPRVGIVIHATAGVDSLDWLRRWEPNPAKRSSSDFLITRAGHIHRVIPAGNYSFHSGMARFNGYQEADGSINRGFYGIEVENLEDGAQQFNNVQYISLAALVRALITLKSLSTRNICTHHECALPHGRKTDPLLLDWAIVTREMLHPSSNTPNLVALKP